jgi:hypothetical protein
MRALRSSMSLFDIWQHKIGRRVIKTTTITFKSRGLVLIGTSALTNLEPSHSHVVPLRHVTGRIKKPLTRGVGMRWPPRSMRLTKLSHISQYLPMWLSRSQSAVKDLSQSDSTTWRYNGPLWRTRLLHWVSYSELARNSEWISRSIMCVLVIIEPVNTRRRETEEVLHRPLTACSLN